MLVPSPPIRIRASLSGTRLMQTIDFTFLYARFRVCAGQNADRSAKLQLLYLVGGQRIQAIGDQIRAQINRRSEVALRYVQLVGPGWLVKTSSGKVARKANREKFLQVFGRP